MVTKYQHSNERLLVEEDGVVVFDTDLFPVQLFPSSEVISITGKTITWPDFVKGNAYGFAQGMSGGSLVGSCHSYAGIPGQNWGSPDATPPPASGYELNDEIIGVAPPGTDLLYVRVKLTRTNAPDQINGVSIPVLFEEGQWVTCVGGSLPVERLFPIARYMEIVLRRDANGEIDPNVDGTVDILLRRKQSADSRSYSFYRFGGDTQNSGWTAGGTGGAFNYPVFSLQAKGPVVDPTGVGGRQARGGSDQCSLIDVSDYSTTLTGDIEVIPGCSLITPQDATGGDSKAYIYLETRQEFANLASYSLPDFQFGPANPERYIYFALFIGNWQDGTQRDISGASITDINGTVIPATLIAKRRTFFGGGTTQRNLCAAIFAAHVPDGVTGTINVSYTGTAWQLQLAAWAGYNMDNPLTPVSVVQSSDVYGGTSGASMATGAGGFVIGHYGIRGGGDLYTEGFLEWENYFKRPAYFDGSANFSPVGGFGDNPTTGANIRARCRYKPGDPDSTADAGADFVWVAAAFA
jgi:hypothetical protein